MAAVTLPAPGTKLGPCEDCTHSDCVAARRQASATCSKCFQPIGYERRFYRVDAMPTAYHHSSCVET